MPWSSRKKPPQLKDPRIADTRASLETKTSSWVHWQELPRFSQRARRPTDDSATTLTPSLEPNVQSDFTTNGPRPNPLSTHTLTGGKKPKQGKLYNSTSSIASLLRTTTIVGDTTNIPYLKGLSGIALLIITTAKAAKDNDGDYSRMINMVLELASVLNEYIQKPDDNISRELNFQIQSLDRTLVKVLQFLHRRGQQKRIFHFLNVSTHAKSLQDCEQDLEQALNMFKLRSQIDTASSITRRATEDDIFFADALKLLQTTKIAVRGAEATGADTTKSMEHANVEFLDLPPPPPIFFGRDTELRHLVDALAQSHQAHVVVCGPAGVGKSSVALAVIHNSAVQKTYDYRRYFVSCDLVNRLEGLLHLIMEALGLSNQSPQAPLHTYKDHILTSLSRTSGRCLLVLDNFESPWEPLHTRLAVEDFLTEISSLETVSLVITLRGIQIPLGPQWHKPHLSPLRPLGSSAARETFLAISDVEPDDPNVDRLIDMVDGLALPVNLMAHLAQYESTSSLVERYSQEGPSMLSRGEDRHTSMNASIEQSLASPRIAEYPQALELLRIISSHTDGISRELLPSLAPQIPQIQKHISVLRYVSLVFEDDARKLQVLAPIRGYLRSSSSPPLSRQNTSSLERRKPPLMEVDMTQTPIYQSQIWNRL